MLKTKTIWGLVVLLLVLNLSCTKKKYPETIVVNEPVFFTKLKINNVEYIYSGGVDDYRMFSSYQQDGNGVNGFVAELKRKDCDGVCTNSLRIQINDYKVRASSEPVEINKALFAGNYELMMAPQEVQFNAGFNKTAKSYLWDFGDGTTSSLANPTHIYLKEGYYKVCLTVTDANNCMSTVCGIQKFGFFDKACLTGISVNNATGNQLSFSSNTKGGKAPYQYYWAFGDGTVSTLANPVHVYKYGGSYPVSLRVIDAAKDTAYAEYNAVTAQDNSSCAANYTLVSVSDQLASLSKALSEVIIRWTDESGTVYESNKSVQPTASYFRVSSVEDFENNENDQRTKKLKVIFSCNLYNGSKVLHVDNAEAVICVAYK